MKNATVTIQGITALLMHNERLSNPLDSIAKQIKAITSKRIKTDEDHEAISQLEFEGGLYFDKKAGVYIPGRNIAACIREGAAIQRKGTDVKRGVTVTDEVIPLVYEGPRTIKDLYRGNYYDMRSVSGQGKKGGSRTTRTRPLFATPWACTFTLWYNPEVINGADLKQSVVTAGELIGLCDYRPSFGKFEVQEWRDG